jgi:short-subunit dehydrogenase
MSSASDAKKAIGAAAGLLLGCRLLYNKWADSTPERIRRFRQRFGAPDQGIILVTGASSGVGRALAAELSDMYGYDLMLVARRESNLVELANQLHTKCIVLPCDLQNAFADDAGVLNFRRRIEAALPPGKTLAGCVHMAGDSDLAVHSLTDKAPARNLAMLDLNCRGTLGTLQAVVPLLARHVARTGCRSVAVTPGALTAFLASAPTFATSTANKNYIRALTLSCRYEYAPAGIDFVCACPVAVRSEILDNADAREGVIARMIYIPTGAEWARGVVADLALGLAETNGRYLDFLANFITYGPGRWTREFFHGRVQANSVLLNREIDLRPLREKVEQQS